MVADNLSLPHPLHSFDFAISIAVIHHISTPDRRIEAVKAILDLLKKPSAAGAKDGGKAVIEVWALEQKDSRRGWDEGHDQDVMVPWVMRLKKEKEKGQGKKKKKTEEKEKEEKEAEGAQNVTSVEKPNERTFLRYYHLFRKGELEHDIEQAGGEVLGSGYEKDNWWAVAMLKV